MTTTAFNTQKDRLDAYELVTARIVEALEAGIVPWHKPWTALDVPRSLGSGKAYRGVNVFVLGATAAIKGYTSPYWVTFNEAKKRGGSIRKGEHGTPVVFWKMIKSKERDENGKQKLIPFLRYSTVFNVEQADGVEAPAVVEGHEFEGIEGAEAIIEGWDDKPEISYGGDSAFYSPQLDSIRLPLAESFETPSAFYSTLFHEAVHSTGHSSRLDRKGITEPHVFGSPSYAREELVAEMGAAFLTGEAGIELRVPEHAGYIAGWLRALENDKKLVVKAAGDAARAAGHILGQGSAPVEEPAEAVA